MKPSDALQQDWRLYYDQSWMEHKIFGPGLVRVIGNGLYFYRFPGDEMEAEGTAVRGTDLSCWWPRSGSYNAPGGAIYLARKTARSMRKSAHPSEHYVIKWGHASYGAYRIMLQLRNGPAIVDIDFAKKAIAAGVTSSAAVAHDIILTKGFDDEEFGVVFRGIHTGVINDDEFTPASPGAALARRTVMRLREEEII